MSESSYPFRTALGGFHKGDVTGFIEKTAALHRIELQEYEALVTSLREENRALHQQLHLMMMSTPITTPAPAPDPEPDVETVVEPVVEAVQEPAPAPAPIHNQELVNAELMAYRRAEAVERNAAQRARNLYQQLENMCEDTLGKFQSTDSAVKQAIDMMMEQANALDQAYQALSDALNGSREKLASMNTLLLVEEPKE